MSIQAKIARLVGEGKLAPYMPRGRHPPKRRLYLTESAVKDLDSKSAVSILSGRGFVEAALARWTLGGLVYGDANGIRCFLKRLCPPPPEIWEMRVTDPRPQARLFGRFAEPNTLILSKFHTRPMLGDKGSKEWAIAMATCEATWNTLFEPNELFSAKTIREYVTENCDDYPLCPA